MGAFIEAIPIPKPPIILKITNNVIDSGKKDGNPEPQAEIVNKIAENNNDFFLPIALLKKPAPRAPTKHPKSALLTIKPLRAPVNSKYFEK